MGEVRHIITEREKRQRFFRRFPGFAYLSFGYEQRRSENFRIVRRSDLRQGPRDLTF
jgi:hypothetical protein